VNQNTAEQFSSQFSGRTVEEFQAYGSSACTESGQRN
jgi:hypothetical protein